AGGQNPNNVAWRYRSVKLASFGGLADDGEALPVESGAHLLGIALEFEIARLQLALHGLESGAIVLGGTQRLALRQQKIACEAVLDAHDFAHLAELGHAFEQNDFHFRSPSDVWMGRSPLPTLPRSRGRVGSQLLRAAGGPRRKERTRRPNSVSA